MRFEKFLLDDYLQTEEGKELFSFFKNMANHYFNHFDFFLKKVDSFIQVSDTAEYHYNNTNHLYIYHGHCRSFQDFFEKYRLKDHPDPRVFQDFIPEESVLWFLKYPDYAFPYLYPSHFFIFQGIMDNFDIPLPPIPKSSKALERCNYYFDICRSLYDFRQQYHLSPVELCVFLYGFARRYIPYVIKNINELPPANNIFLVAGKPDDCENCLKITSALKPDIWSNGKKMMAGDIVLLYEMFPVSSIIAAFRCLANGYDDPFNYWNDKIILGAPVVFPPISLKKLQAAPVWKENALVKRCMQGTCGNLCSVQEYNVLKDLIKEADPNFPIASLPEPPPYAQFYHEGIETEKDVEEKLLEPLLAKLGYNVKKEFTRQFPIRMGRGIRYYPDYALHAKGTRGEERADFIWEAKYRIPTQKQLREDYGQAKSYAIRLQTKGFGLVSIEGVKIWTAASHFDFDKLISRSWEELEMPEKMGKLKILFNGLCKPKNLRQ